MVYYVLMGLFDRFLTNQTPTIQTDVAAANIPFNLQQSFGGIFYGAQSATREQAMGVPAIARARNIICSSIASLPLEGYNKFTGAHVEPTQAIWQPDPRIPASATYAWLAEDLLFHGVAYGVVLDAYASSDGSRIRSWTRVAPNRVTFNTNAQQTEITEYLIDGMFIPQSGVGSIIVFSGLDEGVLTRSGRTIRAALELEKAAEVYAKEPVPTMVLKSNGTNLTPERISKLLESWKISRTKGATAFLNADVELQTLGFDPVKLQLNEARQYVALECARATGIPAYFISAETTSMTYSNSIGERKALIDFSLRPIMTVIEQRLTMPDFNPYGTEIRYSVDDFLRGDPLQRAQVYEILNRIGAMSVEQIQEEEDLIK
jgi:HK97 family phage portal protein